MDGFEEEPDAFGVQFLVFFLVHQQQFLGAAGRLDFHVGLALVQLLSDEHLFDLLEVVRFLLLFGVVDKEIQAPDEVVREHFINQAHVLVIRPGLEGRVETPFVFNALEEGMTDRVGSRAVAQLDAKAGPRRGIQDVPQQFCLHEGGPPLVNDVGSQGSSGAFSSR